MSVQTIITFVPCCDPNSRISYSGSIEGIIDSTVYIYTGPSILTTPTNFFVSGQCYTIYISSTPLPSPFTTLPSELTSSTFIYDPINAKSCTTPYCQNACQPQIDNNWSSRFLIYTPCCGGDSIYFRISNVDGTYPGTLPYEGVATYTGLSTGSIYSTTDVDGNPSTPLVSNTCYSITSSTTGPLSAVTNQTEYYNLVLAPSNDFNNYIYHSPITPIDTDCLNYISECPDCNPSCYALWPCDGSIPVFTTNSNLNAYIGQSILVNGVDPNDNINQLCVYVEELVDTICTDPIDITIDPQIYCDCDCTCYSITGENIKTISYIDCDGNNTVLSLPPVYNKFCAKTYPIVISNSPFNILSNGECSELSYIDNITCQEIIEYQCTATCYKLIDCTDNTNILYSTTASLQSNVINNEIITIDGFEECWRVELTEEECDCPIDVTILTVSNCCRECQGNPNYIVINCDNSSIFNYTSQDLSAYVGQSVIRDDCGGCWIVQKFNGNIPSDITFNINASFLNCEICQSTNFYLIDCHNSNNVITGSSQGGLFPGLVVQLDWYPNTCWTVSLTSPNNNISYPSIGNIDDRVIGNYSNCIECITYNANCICSTIKNYNSFNQTYQYINCSGLVQSITLSPGQKSNRICLIKWLVPNNCDSFILSYNNINYTLFKLDTFNGKPRYIYLADTGNITVFYDGSKWVSNSNIFSNQVGYYLECSQDCDCPIGNWHSLSSIPSTLSVTTTEFLYTIEEFGECINGICPPRKYTKKSVRPGYNTPACENWKYEEISCKSAEALYKQVLELRYGISNCCPEDDEQYIIQKELIDLQALIPPAKIIPVPSPPIVSTIYTTFKAI